MRITHYLIAVAAGAVTVAPALAQESPPPAEPPQLTAEQTATMGAWPTEKQADFMGWPAAVQAYFWSLPPDRQDVFWRLSVNDRVAIAGMDAEAQAAAWTMIDEKLEAMSSAPSAPPPDGTSPPPVDDADSDAPEAGSEP